MGPETMQYGVACNRGVAAEQHDQVEGKNTGNQQGPYQGHAVGSSRSSHGGNASGPDIVPDQENTRCYGSKEQAYFFIHGINFRFDIFLTVQDQGLCPVQVFQAP